MGPGDIGVKGGKMFDQNMSQTYHELAEHLATTASSLPHGEQYWVAVAGSPASGKSTTTARIAHILNEEKGISTAVLPMDGYHYYRKQLDEMPEPEEKHRRRGAHWTFDGYRFVNDLQKAREARQGFFPSFDHHTGDPMENAIKLEPRHQVVLVEGNYVILYGVEPWGQLDRLFNERWYISCSLETARARVIARHMSTGDSLEKAVTRAESNDLLNAVIIEEGSRPYADKVIESR